MEKALQISYDPIYAHPLPSGHRFPMLKYELIPGQLLHEGTIKETNLHAPQPCIDEIILWTHETAYLRKLKDQQLTEKEQRHIGFPQSPELTQRELVITQGTIDCCKAAFSTGVSLNVAGGTDHAFAGRGEGFCMLNDMAVAANYLLKNKLSRQILVIDLDVHQGNGTASIFQRQDKVFTFSMHGAHNYPFHKEKSDLDLALEDGTGDALYLSLLSKTLAELIDKVKPDFAFYLSGVDVLSSDRYGKLNVSVDGCKQRDAFVFSTLHQHSIPCAVAMGGGYSADVKVIVEAHCNTFRTAKDIYGLL